MTRYYYLFSTIVGSHMWGMERPTSDIDLNVVYAAHPADILAGEYTNRSFPMKKFFVENEDGKREWDIHYYEVGHLVNLLIKGNVNAIWATCSPKIPLNTVGMEKIPVEVFRGIGFIEQAVLEYRNPRTNLAQIVVDNVSKASYHSIRGMAVSQFNDNLKRAEVMPEGKALKTCMRTCEFGVRLLLTGEINFKTTTALIKYPVTVALAKEWIDELDKAYKESPLRESPNERAFRAYLLNLRKHMLSGDLQ